MLGVTPFFFKLKGTQQLDNSCVTSHLFYSIIFRVKIILKSNFSVNQWKYISLVSLAVFVILLLYFQ